MMSTALHTPSHSPVAKSDLHAFRSANPQQLDLSFHPAFSPTRRLSATPPRKKPLLLTPSPLRRSVDSNVDFDSAMNLDFDEFSAQASFSTPFHPTRISSPKRSRFDCNREPLPAFPAFLKSARPADDEDEDDDEGLFLRTGVGHTSLHLHTPEKLRFDTVTLPKSVSNPKFTQAPKRKIQHMESSPSRHGMTPLHIRHEADSEGASKRLATLAPLPAPKFLQTRNSVGNNMGRHVASLKNMRISDRSMDLDFDDSDSDKDFSTFKSRRSTLHLNKPLKGIVKEEVAISPDGHINKRRTQSRPVSLELLRSSPSKPSPKLRGRERIKDTHRRNGSNTSVSETGSPIRTSKVPETAPTTFNRLASSATLFFGPAIVKPGKMNIARPVLDQVMSDAVPPSTPIKTDEDPFSPISPNDSFTNAFPKAADTSLSFAFSVTSEGISPRQRIPTKFKKPRDSGVVLSDDTSDDELRSSNDDCMLLKPDTLLRIHSRSSTYPAPSTNSLNSESTAFDDSFVTPSHETSRTQNNWADSSTLDVSIVDDFIAKTLEAGAKDTSIIEKKPPGTPQKKNKTAFLGLPVRRPWQSAFTSKLDRTPLFGSKLPGPNFGTITDSGGSAGDLSVPKAANGKPRKSCPTNLRFPSFDEQEQFDLGSVRRKEGAFVLGGSETSPTEAQPKNPRIRTYGDVGMGRPSVAKQSGPLNGPQFLMRRSSSGAFSTISTMSIESDTCNLGTPTRKKVNEFSAPALPLRQQPTPGNLPSAKTPSPLFRKTTSPRLPIRGQLVGVSRRLKENKRPETMYNLPLPSVSPMKPKTRQQKARVSDAFVNHHLLPPRSSGEEEGRYEHDFIEVEKIGSGEFGSAMKVRYKDASRSANEVFAIKKSRRLEGSRHRLRLLEEVDVLRHLSSDGQSIHPNVLGYIDSWEQDSHLYILSELCDFGNFAHFLSEYGLHFAKLEEARVWKIFSDISAGLHFIHEMKVVHFDLKPANIFITAAGRFKIGDFGMASFWPRKVAQENGTMDSRGRLSGFEREGDKMYLAAEVLQGKYGPEADIFSFGMMMLETATNIIVPTQGDLWHKLRDEDFSLIEAVDECSTALILLIGRMMRKDPSLRPTAASIYAHPVITNARNRMEQAIEVICASGDVSPEALFKASPLAGTDEAFLDDILSTDDCAMDCSL